jgi:CDP-glucose 4,6-dehydratase
MVGDELRRLNGSIFITGHTGFKGSWLSLLLKQLGIEHFGYSLEAEEDSLYKRANLEKVSKGVVGDIRDLENLSKVIKNVRPSAMIHLAAQPLVLKSYQDPLETFQTNCIGTANVLKAAFESPSVEIVLVITTDKVYRNNNSGRRFVESDPLEGKDPYSASKVAAEAVCAAWQQMSKIAGGPKVLVARAGNVIGGGDFAKDRLIPDAIRAIISEQNLLVRSPEATRPWQHVLDPLIGYLKYIESVQSSLSGEPSLNFGPFEPSLRVDNVLEIAKDHFEEKLKVIYKDTNQEIESQALELDPSRAIAKLGWRPHWNQEEAIDRTFVWWAKTLANPTSALENCLEDIEIALGKELYS